MTYTRISSRGKEVFKDEAAYERARAARIADEARREELLKEHRALAKVNRSERDLRRAYLDGEIEAEDLEAGLDELFGLKS